jgi:hypothetical protein
MDVSPSTNEDKLAASQRINATMYSSLVVLREQYRTVSGLLSEAVRLDYIDPARASRSWMRAVKKIVSTV